MGKTEITFNGSLFQSNAYNEALRTTRRKKLILGRQILTLPNKMNIKTGIVYYEPSPFPQLTESIYCKGQPGSGKSWICYSLSVQTFFAERRTWILIDTKGSVSWDTEVFIRENGFVKKVKIGEFIDGFIPNENKDHDIYEVDEPFEVLSLCPDHKIRWKKITQFSKHRPMTPILKILTKSGKEIIATSSHSFIMLKNGKYIPILGKDLKIGDYVPVSDSLPYGSIGEIDVTSYFNEEEIVDFDNIFSAVSNIFDCGIPLIESYSSNGLSQISCGALGRYKNGERQIPLNRFKIITQNHSKCSSFPKKIALDELTGYFLGMFVANGYVESTKERRDIFISNGDEKLKDRLEEWLNRYNIHYKRTDKGIKIRSIILSEILIKMFGYDGRTDPCTKHLPDFFFNANKLFLRGFIDGYMSGDGTIRHLPHMDISFCTRSKILIQDLNILFTMFGMPLRIISDKVKNGLIYYGYLHSSDLLKYKEIGFTKQNKQDRLDKYQNIEGFDSKYLIDIDYILSDISWRKETKKVKNVLHKEKLPKENLRCVVKDLMKNHPDKAKKLMDLINGDVWWDEITNIVEIESPSEYVYDFAINETENFMLANGVFVHNSYRGTNRPNMKYAEVIRSFGGTPRGIPANLIDVIAPVYHIESAEVSKLKSYQITGKYLIPLRFLPLNAMFELTKMNTGASYAATFDQKFKDIMIRTKKNPKLVDIHSVISGYANNKKLKRLAWTFDMLDQKIRDIEDRAICERKWSRLGEALFQAVAEGKPRWIAFTLALDDYPDEDMNLAFVTAILTEIKDFADIARMNNWKISLGVMIDELHMYVRNKEASTRHAIHDLLLHWGRSEMIMRSFITQKDEQLDKVFRDGIGKLSPTGTYDILIEASRIPEPGTVAILNRATVNLKDPDNLIYYPKVASCPPLCEVESKDVDDEKWKAKMLERYMNQKEPKYSQTIKAKEGFI